MTNHLNFCMMAATVTWIYADHLDQAPKRFYAVNDRTHFAFSDVRKLITQAALNKDFDIVCPKLNKRRNNSLIDVVYAVAHAGEAKAIAWKAQKRLCGRYKTLTQAGKNTKLACVAIARELAGFIWDITCQEMPKVDGRAA